MVLITVDTLRSDRVSAYGGGAPGTPSIDRLASQGALFTTAYCDVPWTTGSMASVMTGSYSGVHGVRFPWQRLPESRLTLAEILQARGFLTAAVVGSFPLDSAYGLDQGFDLYDDEMSAPAAGIGEEREIEPVEMVVSEDASQVQRTWNRKLRNDAYRPDDEVSAAAVAWLRRRAAGPFLLWVHYFGPHERLTADDAPQRERIIADYGEDLARTDAAVGRLLEAIDALGLAERTLVVFHSDHGQALGEHGLVGHGRDLFEASVRIPLIVRYPPRIEPGTRVDEIARNVDILPTVLDLLGIEAPAATAGRSLGPLLAGESGGAPASALMQVAMTPPVPVSVPGVGRVLGPTRVEALRRGRWKYVRTSLAGPCTRADRFAADPFGINPALAIAGVPLPEEQCRRYRVEELHAVASDDGRLASERTNLLERQPDVAAIMREELQQAVAAPVSGEDFELDPAQRAKLRSLGYLE